jgi:putative ABC transport system permease protein
VSHTVSALYVQTAAVSVAPDIPLLARAAALGVAAAVLAALVPALEAARADPAEALREGTLARRVRLRAGWAAIAGLALLAASALVGLLSLSLAEPLLGFASAALVLGGFAAITPMATGGAARALAPVSGAAFGMLGKLAARYLTDSLEKTSVAIGALMASVAMLVGLSVMIDSFRGTVLEWVRQTIRADVFVEPAGRVGSASEFGLPAALVAALRQDPATESVATYRGIPVVYRGQSVWLAAIDLDLHARYAPFRFVDGRPGATTLRQARARGEMIATESFATRFRVRAGDRIALATPHGRRAFRVAGIFYDYTTDAGSFGIDRALYRQLWNDPVVTSAGIYLRPGADQAAFIRRTRIAAGPAVVVIRSNADLRQHITEIFDDTFRITYALHAIALAVAVLGVLGTLTTLVIQRGREIATLRAIGATRRQVWTLTVLEGLLLGLCGLAIGAVCGVALAIVLIQVINRQFFGWSIDLRFPPLVLAGSAALIIASSLAASYLPARQAAARLPAEALRQE